MNTIKKTVIAVAAGIALVASQATASAQTPLVDRVGEEKEADHALVPLALLGLVALVIIVAGSSSSDDKPASA